MNNVRQICLAMFMYAGDNQGKFPFQTSLTNGGTMEFLDRNQTSPHFQKAAEYIRAKSLLVCPDDKKRQVAETFETLADTNVSYFLNADVTNAASILCGDRHLQANGVPVRHGTFIAQTNMALSWTSEMHRGNGILGFADGHAQVSRPGNLNAIFERQGLTAARLSVP